MIHAMYMHVVEIASLLVVSYLSCGGKLLITPRQLASLAK